MWLQVAESIGRKLSNYGRLVFADKTTTKFVVVELCIHTCIPSKQRAEQRAHLLFCLARHALPVPAPWQCITATPGARGSFLGLMIVLCACLLLPGLSTPFFGQKLQHKL